jgi:membrane protease subunit (stomatin/prohibitin family)
LGEHLDSLLNLPGTYDQLSSGLQESLKKDLSHFGLGLTHLYITSITPPPEVQATIDDKSRLNVIPDLDRLVKMKAAMAMEKAAANQGEAGAGLGMGMGFMMPAMFADAFRQKGGAAPPENFCPDCKKPVTSDAKFCPHCGHQQLVFDQCAHCGKNLPPNARFCPKCGQKIEAKPQEKICPHCKEKNLPDATFCNQCGERL